MPAEAPSVLITLPPQPQYLALVRRVLGGFAAQLGISEPEVGDLKTVVTEACGNAVGHGGPGGNSTAVRVEASRRDGELAVVVSERGRGLRRWTDIGGDPPLGLRMISMLCSHYEISEPRRGETEMKMRLALRG